MLTEIGVTIGTMEDHQIMAVLTLTMALKPFLKLKIGKYALQIFFRILTKTCFYKFFFLINRNVRDFILKNKEQIKFFNSIHSYSQLILLPWGFTADNAPGYDKLKSLADRSNEALHAVHGTNYEVGCIPCLLYIASGGSMDWALGEAGIPYSYGMELRDTGLYGFLLPPDQIIPTAEETWAFHQTAARIIIDEFA